MVDRFPNLETGWHAEHESAPVELEEIAKRMPSFEGDVVSLSGGLANDTFRLGDDRVLRIYRRDPLALSREYELLSRPWQHFRVPRILDRGDDFLVLEFVPHGPLCNTSEQGHAVGTALGEIHQTVFDTCGIFGSQITLAEPWPDFASEVEKYISSYVERAESHRPMIEVAVQFVSDRKASLQQICSRAVLLHGDFKPSNLHWTAENSLLVLDWEFTYAGPALMDIGQLFRFGSPGPFRQHFVDGYKQLGGQLNEDWDTTCQVLDLVNLVGLLQKSEPNSRRADDCRQLIQKTLGS